VTGRHLQDLTTPALLLEADAFEHNLNTMAAALPGSRLRPHVKAHKCTSLAARQAALGHRGFTCATIREVEGLAAAGLGEDLLLANEVVDATRLGRLDARVTIAVDSAATVAAAARGGVKEVLIDVNVGLPRCGIPPSGAGALAELARAEGLRVRGVMGYEGHVVGIPDRAVREERTREAMEMLVAAHADVGGEVISGGGTGTYDLNTWVNELQAGSYALMDTAYAKLDLPFRQALQVQARVISVSTEGGWAVADCGLKALGMDHGNPDVEGGTVFSVSDEHISFVPDQPLAVGDLVRVMPAHCDPTMALHERVHLVSGDDVLETWAIDLRGW
jgi:D-serine deaminase-like pyridoxal phosphate-dependent protein